MRRTTADILRMFRWKENDVICDARALIFTVDIVKAKLNQSEEKAAVLPSLPPSSPLFRG